MTVYYTAKDIEEMAARGIRQIEIGPGITLTDFAKETARQLDIKLVSPGSEGQPRATTTPAAATTAGAAAPTRRSGSGKYNKPPGCMHGPLASGAASPQQESRSSGAPAGGSSTVNRLIDLMGKVMNRGE